MPTQTENDHGRRGGKQFGGIFTVLGWLMGVVSLINLVSDAGFVQLKSDLLAWQKAYQDFVTRVGNWVFGWVDFRWMEVSPIEIHMVVLTWLVASILSRTYFSLALEEFGGLKGYLIELRSYPTILLMMFVFVLPGYSFTVIFAILLPDPYGVAGQLIFIVPVVLYNLAVSEPFERADESSEEVVVARSSLTGKLASLVENWSNPLRYVIMIPVVLSSLSGRRFRVNTVGVLALSVGVVLVDSLIHEALAA